MFDSPLVRKLVSLALEEDLSFGDVTSEITVPVDRRSHATIIARQRLVVCGLGIVDEIVRQGGWKLAVIHKTSEGSWVDDGAVLIELSGSTRELLAAERTCLNFLQRLSGVATAARAFVESQPKLTVLDTRKTMPGWRLLDKYAVRIGGARNHRLSLGDMVLVKNNHIDANPGGIRGALAGVVAKKPLYMPWEVEVRTLEELSIALEYKPTIVMLDNFTDAAIRDALALIEKGIHKPVVEVSGGISMERLSALSQLGVEVVSVGGLTTRAPNVDISMRIS